MTMPPQSSESWRALLDAVAVAWPVTRWRDVGVVVGCSGGADSVGLLLALCRLRLRKRESGLPRGFLVAAHFNHKLRDAESDADEAFVRELAQGQGVEFVSGRSQHRRCDEASMRAERLAFLTHAAHRSGARYLALAHSADDNVETLLHHLVRGTGPAGLAGMSSPQPVGEDLVLVRPMLHVSRASIRNGLEEIGQPWREDASNANLDYRRNWIRGRLIPLIQSEFPLASDAITRAIDGQQGWRSIIDRLATQWIASHCRQDDPLTLSRDPSTEQPIIIAATQMLWRQRDWPRGEMTRAHWLRLADSLAGCQAERYTLPGQVDVQASGQVVQISRSEVLGATGS